MNLKGVVLCGGEGRRFRPLSFYIQKVMVSVGSAEKPLLEYIVRLFKYHGIWDLVFLVGYKSNQIWNYFGGGSRFGVNITYVRDEPDLKGNGGALYNAFKKGAISENDTLIVYYGDILSNIDLRDLLKKHSGSLITVAVSKKYKIPVGVVEMENSKIVRIQEKPDLGMPVTIGVLVMEGKIKGILDEISVRKKHIDIMKDVLPAAIKRYNNVKAYVFEGFWYDVGSIEKFEKLENGIVDRELGFLFEERKFELL